MASRPGLLTHWPWQKLGNMKYAVLVPWAAHSLRKFMEGERNLSNLAILPTLLLRLLHGQLWITLSRFQTTRSKRRIVDKSLDFDQVDRERNWDDQIILTALILYMADFAIPGASCMPWWDAKGVAITIALHTGPVEFIYYWLHRALHHHFLYSRYHSHHHSSIVTEPITAVIHPFAEEMSYFLLFAVPLLSITALGVPSIGAVVGYLTYIDFMNYMGHCNFELVPKWLFNTFPPLKYLMYTPSFHSLHHTQFRTNYCLFMPLYDYVYGTVDQCSDELYEKSIEASKKQEDEEELHVVHLTHLTTLHSIFHTRLGLASLSSKPYAFKWYLWLMWPFTWASTLLAWLLGTSFVVMERNKLKKLQMETWSIPRYSFQYTSCERENINGLIERAIVEADARGSKVVSLGLLNQSDRLNGYGIIYVKRNPKLKTFLVDGTGLAVAVVLNSVPKEAQSVLLIGKLSKMAFNLCLALCLKCVKVEMVQQDEYKFLKLKMPAEIKHNLVFSDSERCESKIWLIGDGVNENEQRKAKKGITFVPFSQFPPKVVRKDCSYHTTPAMVVPKTYENLHTCENWLPRRVISAWRVAGIIHALEGWNTHECGDAVTSVEKAWHAALHHGFSPFKEQLHNPLN